MVHLRWFVGGRRSMPAHRSVLDAPSLPLWYSSMVSLVKWFPSCVVLHWDGLSARISPLVYGATDNSYLDPLTTRVWIHWKLVYGSTDNSHIDALTFNRWCAAGSHMQTLMIDKLGFEQNYYTSTLILLIKIVLCSKFPWTEFMNYKCFDMNSGECRGGGVRPFAQHLRADWPHFGWIL